MPRDRAGVLLTRGDATLMTLSQQRRWRSMEGGTQIPIRWLGGKLDAGESFPDCARRETQEESGLGVELVDAERTFVGRPGADPEPAEPNSLALPATALAPRPLLVAIGSNGRRSVTYRATTEGRAQVADVPAILWVPFAALPALGRGLPFARFAEHGIELEARLPVPPDAVGFLGKTGTEQLMRDLVERHGPHALRVGAPLDLGAPVA